MCDIALQVLEQCSPAGYGRRIYKRRAAGLCCRRRSPRLRFRSRSLLAGLLYQSVCNVDVGPHLVSRVLCLLTGDDGSYLLSFRRF